MSAIEWTDETWNPVTGCTKVSAGCKNCYAEGVAKRFWGDRKFGDVEMHTDRLRQPFRWRKPKRVFVNSMSDLFHEDVPDYFVAAVFAAMSGARNHTFQVLTKRPKRMHEVVSSPEFRRLVSDQVLARGFHPYAEIDPTRDQGWPLPNVWLGVSVEDQATADERIPVLLRTPAAVRFLSCEPLLGPVRLDELREGDDIAHALEGKRTSALGRRDRKPRVAYETNRVDWVIVGGESGPGARPCNVDWMRSIVGQCKTAGVPVFVKQLGARPVWSEQDRQSEDLRELPLRLWREPLLSRKGSDPSEWPEDLRVREFPEVTP